MRSPLPLALVRALSVTAMALSLCGQQGCVARAAEDRTVDGDDPLLDEAGIDDGGAWQSAPFTRSLWIPYRARSSVTISHGLGRVPTSVEVYLSGDGDDRETPHPRTSQPAAGNIAILARITDEVVTVDNNTAGDFFIRLVVR